MIRQRYNGQHWRGVTLALVLFLLVPFGGQGATPEATFNAAAIVVDYGDGTYSYAWVPFAEEEISGYELLSRSGLAMLSVSFGGLGQGVCKIRMTGCDLDPCRATLCQSGDRSSPFWQYLQQDTGGGWTVAPLGASVSKVQDGDVDGWAWTGVKPTIPMLSYRQVAELAGLEGVAEGEVPAALNRSPEIEAAGDDGPSHGSLIGGAAVLVVVVSVGSLLVVRSRRVQG